MILTISMPILLPGLLPGLLMTGCSPNKPAANGRLRVVASFYPLEEAVIRIGGDAVTVTTLTAPGMEPHDLELTPKQVEAIATADVFVYLGGGFQPAVQEAVRESRGVALDVGGTLSLAPPPPGEAVPGLLIDPHVWLDPQIYSKIVGEVADALTQARPASASTFRANATAFQAELASLDEAYKQGLSSCKRRVIVTSHAAFGYLAARYGLQQVPISGMSPDAEPDPKHLAGLKDLVEQQGITTIFTETLVSPKVAEALAQEAGVTTAILDPLESLTPDRVAAGDSYMSVMRSNLATLEAALGC